MVEARDRDPYTIINYPVQQVILFTCYFRVIRNAYTTNAIVSCGGHLTSTSSPMASI